MVFLSARTVFRISAHVLQGKRMRDEDKSKEELITELRELRERLPQAATNNTFIEEQFRQILDELPLMIACIDSELRYVFCNKLYGLHFGISPEEVVGKRMEDVLEAETYQKMTAHVESALSGSTVSFDVPSTLPDGTEYLIRTSHIPHALPKDSKGFFSLGNDITELRNVEKALRRSEAWFENLAEHIPGISIQGYRTDGEVVYWNKESEKVYGYTAQEAIGRKLSDLIIPESLNPLFLQSLEIGKRVKESGEFMPPGELNLVHKQGHSVPVYSVHTAVYLESNEPLLFRIDIDLSDRKRIEDELLNAKKLEAIGVLAGGIAHDFNNLIFVIMGNISMVQMKLKGEGPAAKHLAEAEKACLRAKDLTQKFITFSSGGGPLKKNVSIRHLVENVVGLILSGSNISSDIYMPDDLWNADIDENQMRQALSGILANAKESMLRGGSLQVRAENLKVTAMEKVHLNLAEEGRYVKIVISDEGIGISKENLDKIFDPYFSTKYRGSQKGMGFGLAIAHSVIKRHNGQIKVESEPGEGTSIVIIIPASRVQGNNQYPWAGSAPTVRRRVLLMDDEEMLADLAKTMLEHLGYDVDIALNGEEAIDVYSDALEAGRDYDALILDLTVRGGLGGRDTIQKMLYLNPKVKAIVSSGYSNDPIMSDFTKYGFVDILSKPYDLEQLKLVLNRVLEL
jgi:two-component system, cell cycle sensor histidine kinase and response regulator CckA